MALNLALLFSSRSRPSTLDLCVHEFWIERIRPLRGRRWYVSYVGEPQRKAVFILYAKINLARGTG